MNKTIFIRRSALVAGLISALFALPSPAYASPDDDNSPVMVIEDRALRDLVRDRDVVLTQPLDVTDATGSVILHLTTGTTVGRERMETRFAAANDPIRVRTDLRDVKVVGDGATVTNRTTGEVIPLPEGTVIRVKVDQRMVNGVVVRDRIDFRAVLPDGTRVRFRDRAPETNLAEVENEVENEVGNNHRQRGRDAAKVVSNSSGRSAQVERTDRSGRSDRVDRVERSGRPDRVERPERSGRSGGSGPG